MITFSTTSHVLRQLLTVTANQVSYVENKVKLHETSLFLPEIWHQLPRPMSFLSFFFGQQSLGKTFLVIINFRGNITFLYLVRNTFVWFFEVLILVKFNNYLYILNISTFTGTLYAKIWWKFLPKICIVQISLLLLKH